MRWLRLIYNAVAILALVALLGLAALLLASALAGRGLPFTGDFTSSDERVPFDRLVVTASDQGVTAEETPTSSPIASSPTAGPTPSPTATPAAPPVQGVAVGSEGSAETVGATTSAFLQAVETSTETKGSTTITWESSFADFDYALGDRVTMTVNWTVASGAASYDSFALKDYNPTSDKDPGEGTAPIVVYPGSAGAGSVNVTFEFTGLHLDAERNVEIGTGHFKLYLWVDANGDGIPEALAGYGVNVHVEDPQ